MSEAGFKSASSDKMATHSMSVLHAYVHTGSYSGHGGVRCYASHGSMCIPKRLCEDGKWRCNMLSIFTLQGGLLTETHRRHLFSQSGLVYNAKTQAVTNYSHGDHSNEWQILSFNLAEDMV